jgi:hypothetical protein
METEVEGDPVEELDKSCYLGRIVTKERDSC